MKYYKNEYKKTICTDLTAKRFKNSKKGSIIKINTQEIDKILESIEMQCYFNFSETQITLSFENMFGYFSCEISFEIFCLEEPENGNKHGCAEDCYEGTNGVYEMYIYNIEITENSTEIDENDLKLLFLTYIENEGIEENQDLLNDV